MDSGEMCTPIVAKTMDAPVIAIMPNLTFSSRVMLHLGEVSEI